MHSKEKKDVVFLGLGNLLMEDEGFGVHVYRYIEENYRFSPEIEMIDGGTAGFELLPFFEDYDKILMVDAVEFEKEPGFVGLIENDDILAQLTQKMSLHHLGISDVISTAQLLEYTYSEIIMIGVQAKDLEVGLELSDLLQSKIEPVTSEVLRILSTWGINHEKIT